MHRIRFIHFGTNVWPSRYTSDILCPLRIKQKIFFFFTYSMDKFLYFDVKEAKKFQISVLENNIFRDMHKVDPISECD